MGKTVTVDPVPNREGALALPALPPEEREARNAAAVRGLLRRGAGDLVDMLGLGAPVQRPPAVPSSSVACPQCTAARGEPCISAKSGLAWNGYHRSRQRRAQEQREAAA